MAKDMNEVFMREEAARNKIVHDRIRQEAHQEERAAIVQRLKQSGFSAEEIKQIFSGTYTAPGARHNNGGGD